MKSSSAAVFWTCLLLAPVSGAPVDDVPTLPDQYAEVVLRVEGMT